MAQQNNPYSTSDEIFESKRHIQQTETPRSWWKSQFNDMMEVDMQIFCNILCIEFPEYILKTKKKNVDRIVKTIPALFFNRVLQSKVTAKECSIFVKRFSNNNTMIAAVQRCAELFFDDNGKLYNWWNGSVSSYSRDFLLEDQHAFLRYSDQEHTISSSHEVPTIMTFIYTNEGLIRKMYCNINKGNLSFYTFNKSVYKYSDMNLTKDTLENANKIVTAKLRNRTNENKLHPDVDNLLKYVLVADFNGDVPKLMDRNALENYYENVNSSVYEVLPVNNN